MTAYAVLGAATRAGAADLAAALTTPGGTSTDSFPPGGDIYLRLKTGGTAITATITFPTAADPYGVGKAAYTLGGGALPATGDRLFGPFPASEFGDPSDGQVHINYTAIANLTVGVYRMTNG